MSNLRNLFSERAKRSGLKGILADSLTVMFADTRRGFDVKTAEAFDRMKERADSDPRVARYVAKMELSVKKHVPHVLPGAPRMM